MYGKLHDVRSRILVRLKLRTRIFVLAVFSWLSRFPWFSRFPWLTIIMTRLMAAMFAIFAGRTLMMFAARLLGARWSRCRWCLR